MITCDKHLSEIYPRTDKFDFSPRLKQKWGGEKQDQNTNGLVWLQHEKFYLQQSYIYFPICGRHNIFLKN